MALNVTISKQIKINKNKIADIYCIHTSFMCEEKNSYYNINGTFICDMPMCLFGTSNNFSTL